MIYLTGDTHGQNDIYKLFPDNFPDGKNLTRDDYVIILGDFGGIWHGDDRDNTTLNFYKEKKYTVLFVEGNHENFTALNSYPITEWHGGKVHLIADNIIHLMRGQIYEIEGKKFFTFGGGLSIDKHMRIPYVSWWPEEWPSKAEIDEALDNLEKNDWKVDYILTHAAPQSIMRNELSKIYPMMKMDCQTEKFLDEVLLNTSYEMWFCGHYHLDILLKQCKLLAMYRNVVRLDKGYPIVSRALV